MKKDVYKLHIGATALPLKQRGGPAKSQTHRKSEPTLPHPTRGKKILAFIWDKVQFLLVSAVVFAVIYVALNWQAVKLIAGHYWNTWRGFVSPLEQLVADNKGAEEDRLFVPESNARGAFEIPRLDIEVTPPDMRLVIPRINQNVPVVGVKNENLIARRWEELEADIQKSLKNGVIHYPGTSLPGDNGNIVITGHSSYYAWDPGRFKDVFALLHDVRKGDRILMYFQQKKYVYEVTEIKVVLPKDVDVLGPAPEEQLTLITCTPIGTNLKRLIVIAKLVAKG